MVTSILTKTTTSMKTTIVECTTPFEMVLSGSLPKGDTVSVVFECVMCSVGCVWGLCVGGGVRVNKCDWFCVSFDLLNISTVTARR